MGLTFENAFEVKLPPAEAWDVLLDVPRVARCLPGAELTERIDDRTWKGKVAVKLGPVALAFAGTASFAEIDAAARRVTITGAGAEAKGRGRAQAAFRIALAAAGTGRTRVTATTDVTLSGAVAQYGRGAGVLKSVADEIVARFAANLAAELEREQPAATAVPDAAPAPLAPPAAEPAKPLSLPGLLWAALKRWLHRGDKARSS